MSQLLRVKPSQIKPSQDWLTDGTIRYILDCYSQHHEENLPPPPLVRRDPESEDLIAIDGHNLLAVAEFLGKEIDVCLVESREDRLPLSIASNKDMIDKRNRELQDKYDTVLEAAQKTAEKGINNFRDLWPKSTELLKKDI